MSEKKKQGDQIFICYRRDDSELVTGRIYDRLIEKFGEEAVFRDIDAPLGPNIKQHIDSVVRQCRVVLVVIGEKWMAELERRRDELRDYVRIEIESALARDIPVIPVLVQKASMPPEEALPESLRELSYRNGISISNDPHFHADMTRLIKNLERYLTHQPVSTAAQSLRWKWVIRRQSKRTLLFVSAIIILVALSIVISRYRDAFEHSQNTNEIASFTSPTQTPTPPASPTQSPSPIVSPTVSPAPTSTTPTPGPGASPTPSPRSTTSPTQTPAPSPKSTQTPEFVVDPFGMSSSDSEEIRKDLQNCIQKKVGNCKKSCVLNGYGDTDIECEENCDSKNSREKFVGECRKNLR